jgi:hypothetical protein
MEAASALAGEAGASLASPVAIFDPRSEGPVQLGAGGRKEPCMIARMWHGVTPIDRAQAYLAFLHQRALPDYSSVPSGGPRMCYVDAGRPGHFVTLTFPDSIEAVRAFAADVDPAKYYPGVAISVVEFEPTVRHFQVDSEDDLPSSPGAGS